MRQARLIDLMAKNGFVASTEEARRRIRDMHVKLSGVLIQNELAHITEGDDHVMQIGSGELVPLTAEHFDVQ